MLGVEVIDILNIVLFIIPGYLVLYIVSILTDYISEQNTFDRIIHYLFFSFLCYFFSYFSLIVSHILSPSSELTNLKFDELLTIIINLNSLYIVSIAFIFSIPLGFALGTNYFKKGYPHRHFKKYTNKKYSQSVYAELEKEYSKKGAWVTFHMKDKSQIQGKLIQADRDEDKRDYTFVLTEAWQFFPENGAIVELKGEKIAINIKETFFAEYNK